jgi:hypothetical protein
MILQNTVTTVTAVRLKNQGFQGGNFFTIVTNSDKSLHTLKIKVFQGG